MKRAECKIGMEVRDTRSKAAYAVTGERVHATDCGAWVRALHENADGVRDGGVIHWSFLEPLEPTHWRYVRGHQPSLYRLECAEEVDGERVKGGMWWRIRRVGETIGPLETDETAARARYEGLVMEWLEEHAPRLAAWLKEERVRRAEDRS